MSVCTVAGTIITLATLTPPLHQPIKQLCQPVLWKLIPQQLQAVEWAQRFQHPWLDAAVLASAATVTVEFYVIGLAILIWCGLQQQATILLGVLGLVGHVVFRVKDLLESPRPADCIKAASGRLRITVKDYSGDIEDGIPSAHCCGSLMLLYYIIHAASAAGHVPVEYQSIAQLAAAAWVAWIAYGRLYLGVHSPVDLVAGAWLGWLLLSVWQQIEQQYITWMLGSRHLQWQALLVALILLRTQPMPSRYTDTLGYSVAWLGGWAGVVIGYRQMYPAVGLQDVAALQASFGWSSVMGHTASYCSSASQARLQHSAYCPNSSQSQTLVAGCVPFVWLKVVTGLIVTFVAKMLAKKIMMRLLHHMFAFVPGVVRCMWQPPVVGASRCAQNEGTAETGSAVDMQQSKQQAHVLLHSQHKEQARAGNVCGTRVQLSSSSPGHSSMWPLRYAPNGLAWDVVVTAKFLSYVAVGYVIITMDAWWQPLVSRLVYTSSIA